MEKTTAVIKDLKPNGFVLINGTPCRVERVSVTKSGKHGVAKARVEAIGLLDRKRHSIVKPADETIDVPIVTRKRAQVLAIIGDKAQIMDLADFSVFELEIPEERREAVKPGEEIDYFEVVGIKTLKELK
ncbi:MAG: translation initiation factor IF-5A [Candidatus Aenigmarchaeota archaeon]|nr:translation initiation factor IF-5A [Candidatus Aenigmarchaeota archaeon]